MSLGSNHPSGIPQPQPQLPGGAATLIGGLLLIVAIAVGIALGVLATKNFDSAPREPQPPPPLHRPFPHKCSRGCPCGSPDRTGDVGEVGAVGAVP